MAAVYDYGIATRLGVENDCDFIKVMDVTEWSAEGFPYNRVDYACILFWDVNAFASDSPDGSDFTNPNGTGDTDPSVWWVDVGCNGTYEFRMGIAPVWNALVDYVRYATVFYNGKFWYATTDPAMGAVPGIDASWLEYENGNQTELDTAYGYFKNSFITETISTDLGWYANYIEIDCLDIEIRKTACYKYDICNNSCSDLPLAADRGYSIETYDGTEIVDLTPYELESGDCISIDLTDYGDNVYVIKQWDNASGENPNFRNNALVVYEFCGVQTCWETLVRNLWCKEWDPCCESCDQETRNRLERYRSELNKMHALYFQMMYYINVERMKYAGIYDYDDTRAEYVERVGDIVTRLKAIAARCGDCNGATEDTTNPCSSCQ